MDVVHIIILKERKTINLIIRNGMALIVKKLSNLSFKKKLYILGTIFTFIISLFAVYNINYCLHYPFWNGEKVIFIKKGSSLSQITSRLVDEEVLGFPLLFKLRLLGTGEWRELKAGEYLIPPEVTPTQLIDILKSGNVVLHPVTLIEGESSYHITQKLLQDERFQGPCAVPSEGSLLPETYHFPRGTERQAIINRMQRAMKATLATLWQNRPRNCPLQNVEELVTLASIVEKETALPQERPLVAAVFFNRIKANMPLQADPTVLYALTKGMESKGRELSLEELKVESPYNTYIYTGLPPTPITNPGFLSLKAVLYPLEVPYLYFVANGSGGHTFATTLEEHQYNHAVWRKIRDGKKGE